MIFMGATLSKLLRTRVAVTGAGRTDSGVHAVGYVAHFDIEDVRGLPDPAEIAYKLNAILPPSVVVHSVVPAAPDFLFGGCASASRDAGVTMQFVAEMLGIKEFFMAVDELKVADDDSFSVLERVEGGKYLSSTCKALPAAIGWATGSLPEPPNNPQTGMMNMRTMMPALMKAATANVTTGTIAYEKAETPSAKRDTVVKKDMSADAIAAEIVEWLKG